MRQETFHETETDREKAKGEFFIEQRKHIMGSCYTYIPVKDYCLWHALFDFFLDARNLY